MPLGCWTPPRLSRIHTQETADPENLTDFGELREVSAMRTGGGCYSNQREYAGAREKKHTRIVT
jgi:hypothetical protein